MKNKYKNLEGNRMETCVYLRVSCNRPRHCRKKSTFESGLIFYEL